jgi:hypothetical protein
VKGSLLSQKTKISLRVRGGVLPGTVQPVLSPAGGKDGDPAPRRPPQFPPGFLPQTPRIVGHGLRHIIKGEAVAQDEPFACLGKVSIRKPRHAFEAPTFKAMSVRHLDRLHDLRPLFQATRDPKSGEPETAAPSPHKKPRPNGRGRCSPTGRKGVLFNIRLPRGFPLRPDYPSWKLPRDFRAAVIARPAMRSSPLA